MTDLSALTAEELEAKVLLGTSVGTYDRITPGGREALSELVRRASERDQAVRQKEAAIEFGADMERERDQAVRKQREGLKRESRYRNRADRLAAAITFAIEKIEAGDVGAALGALAASEAPE